MLFCTCFQIVITIKLKPAQKLVYFRLCFICRCRHFIDQVCHMCGFCSFKLRYDRAVYWVSFQKINNAAVSVTCVLAFSDRLSVRHIDSKLDLIIAHKLWEFVISVCFIPCFCWTVLLYCSLCSCHHFTVSLFHERVKFCNTVGLAVLKVVAFAPFTGYRRLGQCSRGLDFIIILWYTIIRVVQNWKC